MINIPINCPICNDPLINRANATTDLVIYKNCRLRPTHIFSCAVFMKGFPQDNNVDTVNRVAFTLSMSPMLSVVIYFDEKIITIDKAPPGIDAILPDYSKILPFYIEPDFSDYKKLCSKFKIYLTFS
jgi:hypothetical protein